MTEMFSHILVPVDFTEKNEIAIDVAKQLARISDGQVTLLHVIEFIDYPDDDEIARFYEKLQSRSEKEFERLKKHFDGTDIEVTTDTVINRRAKGIVLYAVENDVDVIVMNSHPINPQQHRGWGTISYQVSAMCPCSVMLIKEPPSPTETA